MSFFTQQQIEMSRFEKRAQEEQKDKQHSMLQNQQQMAELSLKKKMQIKQMLEQASELIDPKTYTSHHIYLTIIGSIEYGQFDNFENVIVRYDIEPGRDWTQITGLQNSVSQYGSPSAIFNQNIVWNFPIEASFKATNPMGWPSLLISVYGDNNFSQQELIGYGSVHIPTITGEFVKNLFIYQPDDNLSFWQKLMYYKRYQPYQKIEIQKPDEMISSGLGREVTKVNSTGTICIKFQVLLRNLKLYGYSV